MSGMDGRGEGQASGGCMLWTFRPLSHVTYAASRLSWPCGQLAAGADKCLARQSTKPGVSHLRIIPTEGVVNVLTISTLNGKRQAAGRSEGGQSGITGSQPGPGRPPLEGSEIEGQPQTASRPYDGGRRVDRGGAGMRACASSSLPRRSGGELLLPLVVAMVLQLPMGGSTGR